MDSDEMMFEIISRLPLKAFDSIRATSKKLNSLTYDSYLFELHKKRNNIVSGFLVQNMTRNNYINEFVPSPHSTTTDLKFLPRKTRIVATNEQGIAVFEVPHPRHHRMVLYYVCKPATKQVLALPNPKTRFQTTMVAVVTMESNPLHYKILRLSKPKKSPLKSPFTHNCEIFDSKEWAWKWLPPSMLHGDVNIPVHGQPITTSGSIYTLLSNGDILKFDTYSEKQTTFSPPLVIVLIFTKISQSL
uniref:F-box protein At5g41720-like n=1 Tax=Erigeron canadensis TaxID=72917 RepID=UPI001CB8D873|nr:F-box protein At5g41720-like [Erigeron canadensis]